MKLRCDVCGKRPSMDALSKSLRSWGRLTYPIRLLNGSRAVTQVRFLCDACQKRALQYQTSEEGMGAISEVPRPRMVLALRTGAVILVVGIAANSAVAFWKQSAKSKPVSKQTVPVAPVERPVAIAPTDLTVKLSNARPRRSESFVMTVTGPEAAEGPVVEFRSPRKQPFLLTLYSEGTPGEWTRRFGLEEAGTWRGTVLLRRSGMPTLSIPVPRLTVVP